MKNIKIIAIVVVIGIVGLVAVAFGLFENEHVAKGHRLFSYYCAHCHGEKGGGNGYNAAYLDPPPRDLTDRVEHYMAEATNEQIFEAISNGVAGVLAEPKGSEAGKKKDEEEEGHGSPLMPYWKFTLSEEEIWSLVAYIRTLHKNDAEKIAFTDKMERKRPRYDAPTKVDFKGITQDKDRLIEEGKKLYNDKYACLSCHRIGETGGRVGPELTRVGFRLNSSWIYRWIKYPQLIKPDTKMPNFGMSDQEAMAVTSYLTTIKGKEQ